MMSVLPGAGLLGLLAFCFWVWMLLSCVTSEHPGENDRLIWTLVILFTNIIGAAAYFFLQRPRTSSIET